MGLFEKYYRINIALQCVHRGTTHWKVIKNKTITIFIIAVIFDLINNFKKDRVWDAVYEKWSFLFFLREKSILQVHYSVLTSVMFRSADTIQWQWDGYKATARMLSCYVVCVKGDGPWGERWFRALIEKEEFVYQEEIIVLSSLRLLCSVWGMKNQEKDLTTG